MFYRVSIYRNHVVYSFDFNHVTKVISFCYLLPDPYKVEVIDMFDDSLDVTISITKEVSYVENQKN